MAICPSCQAQIEIGSGFYGGLFTCPNCRAVYFIGFDGTPEAAQATQQPADYSPQPGAPQPYQQEPIPEIPMDLPQVPPGYEGISSPMDSTQDFYSPQPVNDYNAPLGNDINDAMAPMTSEPDPYNSPVNVPTAQPNFSPLQDVVDFANSDSAPSLATYSVEITGLDSVQNIQLFKEVLTDSKLLMSFEQFKPQIKNGLLRIEKLTAAQAAVIAFRLRPLPLEMKWEQSLQ